MNFEDRLAAKLERRGYEPHIARALARKAAAEHRAGPLLEALAELDAAGRWRDEHVSGFGGNRDHIQPLEEATARLAAANERAGDALAELRAR